MRLRIISLSLLLHLGVAVAFSLSATLLWKKKDLIMPPPVAVEIITVADKTQTDRKQRQKPTRDTKTQSKQAAKKVDKARQAKKRPPKAATNKNKSAKAPIRKKPDEDVKKSKHDPVVATRPALKPPKKTPKKQPRKPKPAQEEEFTSVLKNLAEDQKKTEQHKILKAPTNPNKDRKDFLNQLDLNKPKDRVVGYNLPLGDRVTVSEMDMLRRQLERCWTIPIGARDAENLAIDIFMVVNPDRTVHHAKIVDQRRYKRDHFYRAAADSALRAVHHPECRPLDLPERKYALWKEIVVTFNPKEMF